MTELYQICEEVKSVLKIYRRDAWTTALPRDFVTVFGETNT
jgi:hypothetical protein